MTKIITLLLIVFLSNFAAAQDKIGIDFRTDFSAAFDLADKQNKLVFMYFYVPNCSACDWLAEDFGNASLGKLYNDNYLSYALNATDKGKKMAEYFGVFSFPTLLYVTPEGEVKYSARGYRDGKSIFDTGKLARRSVRDIKKTMDNKYKSNPNDTDHLYDYIEYQFARQNYSKANKLIKEYLNQRENIEKASWMNLVLDYANDPESYSYEVLISEKENFENEFGEKLINETIWNSLIKKVSVREDPNNFSRFENKFIKEVIKEGYDPKDDGLILFYSEYLHTNPYIDQIRLPSSDKSLLTKYALEALLVEDHTFNRKHLITMGVHLIRYYQKENVMVKLNDVLASNFEKDPHHSYLDLQSIALYALGEQEAAVEKIAAARELAFSAGVRSFKPSITEFKRMGIVK